MKNIIFRKWLVIILVLFVLPLAYSTLKAEEVTITTYYPAPEGVYDELRATKMGIGPNYYDPSQYPLPQDDSISLIAEGKVGIGTTNPNEQLEITGNLRLPVSTSTAGIIKSGADNFLYNLNGTDVFLGKNAGNFTMTGTNNLGIGYQSLATNTSGAENIALGYQSLAVNTSGRDNIAVGRGSLWRNTSGGYNIAIGASSLESNTSGSVNVGIGQTALYVNATGVQNIAIGQSSLMANTSGGRNTALGTFALTSNTTGSYNTAVGNNALFNNTTSSGITAVGNEALNSNTTGLYNTAVGYRALFKNTTSDSNTAAGYNALHENTTGGFNTALGLSAGYSTVGSSNVFLGREAGYNETGSNKLYIANLASNTLIYGDFSTKRVGIGTTNPSTSFAVAGLASITGIYNAVKVNTATGDFYYETSSKRYKKDIQPLKEDFSKILKAQPKLFKYKSSNISDIGYIAEDFDELGLKNLVIYDKEKQPDAIQYDKVCIYLLEIVKQQQKEIDELKSKVGQQEVRFQ